jgi:hypothetical protein
LDPNIVRAADVPEEQFQYLPAPSASSVGVIFSDQTLVGDPNHLLATVMTSDAAGNPIYDPRLCDSVNDVTCGSGIQMTYLSHLPKCLNALDTDCVDSVFAIKSDGSRSDGIFLKGMPEKVQDPFEGSSLFGIPRPGTDSVWNIPGIANGGGTDTYAVSAVLGGSSGKSSSAAWTSPFSMGQFYATITPIKLLAGQYVPAHVEAKADALGRHLVDFIFATGCALASATECGYPQAFPLDTTFGLSLRISTKLAGWLHGRIRDPQIQYASDAAGTRFEIQGLPLKVPVVQGWTQSTSLIGMPGMGAKAGQQQTTLSWGDTNIKLLQAWLPEVHNKATTNPSEWFIRALRSDELQGANACMTNSGTLSGMVSTNSTVYSAGPPTFIPATESLDYTLVSPHFTSKDEVFKGTYNLAIRSDVARCIYKFTNAPIKATISVTDDSGQSSVAVESMNEHDGWIYLSASNFEFSSPTVHVRLLQDQPKPVSPVIPSPTPTSAEKRVASPSNKKIAITCQKGKTIKKVVGISPKCPTGYKKK